MGKGILDQSMAIRRQLIVTRKLGLLELQVHFSKIWKKTLSTFEKIMTAAKLSLTFYLLAFLTY